MQNLLRSGVGINKVVRKITAGKAGIGDKSGMQYIAAPYLLTTDQMTSQKPIGLGLFALAWLRQSYQTHIAWVSREVDELARLIETESEPEMTPDAQRRIHGVLAELRLSAISTMDSNQPVDVLSCSINKLMSQLRYELSEPPQAEEIMACVETRLNDLQARAQAVMELRNPPS